MTATTKHTPGADAVRLGEWDLRPDFSHPSGPLARNRSTYSVFGCEGAYRGTLLLSDQECDAIVSALKSAALAKARGEG